MAEHSSDLSKTFKVCLPHFGIYSIGIKGDYSWGMLITSSYLLFLIAVSAFNSSRTILCSVTLFSLMVVLVRGIKLCQCYYEARNSAAILRPNLTHRWRNRKERTSHENNYLTLQLAKVYFLLIRNMTHAARSSGYISLLGKVIQTIAVIGTISI